ncbi:spermidine/putrescine ABC transporter permease PotC [Desulfofundulus thermobenzoicus]|uniref:Spermidine/putrescine ABC transporter permease PotC n=1 Tax=Desulfofundulus thermobenzoicus TaxID=29376 RepID=A0A6N7IN24_9FIRM|nr:spermidine/putrescine ABC transporter permease PotC [Desulfofundulus thermobenzoicus]
MQARWARWMAGGYGFLVYAFLYLPIMILVVYSFNRSKLNAVWTGFTVDWYAVLVRDTAIIQAAWNSLVVAVLSTFIATMIGTLAAVGMHRYHFRGKTALNGMLYIPIIIPEIVMGISLLVFFSLVKIPLGLLSLILAHVTFCIPFVVLTVRARMEGFDRHLEEAAMDLGASNLQTLRYVTMPVIMPGILAGVLLSFTLSLDDVIISFFVSGPGSMTLPLKIYSMVKFAVTPEINALCTIMMVLTLLLVLIAERLRLKKAG